MKQPQLIALTDIEDPSHVAAYGIEFHDKVILHIYEQESLSNSFSVHDTADHAEEFYVRAGLDIELRRLDDPNFVVEEWFATRNQTPTEALAQASKNLGEITKLSEKTNDTLATTRARFFVAVLSLLAASHSYLIGTRNIIENKFSEAELADFISATDRYAGIATKQVDEISKCFNGDSTSSEACQHPCCRH
jgi:hypothetical protein